MDKWIKLGHMIFDRLKGWLVRVALKRLVVFLPGWLSGPIGWIGTIIIPRLIDKVIKPAYNATFRKIYMFFKKKKIKKNVEKYDESKTETEFDDNFDNLS